MFPPGKMWPLRIKSFHFTHTWSFYLSEVYVVMEVILLFTAHNSWDCSPVSVHLGALSPPAFSPTEHFILFWQAMKLIQHVTDTRLTGCTIAIIHAPVQLVEKGRGIICVIRAISKWLQTFLLIDFYFLLLHVNIQFQFACQNVACGNSQVLRCWEKKDSIVGFNQRLKSLRAEILRTAQCSLLLYQ